MVQRSADISPAKKAHILARVPPNIREGYMSAMLKLGRAMAGDPNVRLNKKERTAVQTVEDIDALAYSQRRIHGLRPVRQ